MVLYSVTCVPYDGSIGAIVNFIQFHNEMNAHYYRASCYHGIKDPKQDATSGNHHVINATYHLISEKLGYNIEDELSDKVNWQQFMLNTTVKPGLYNRHPDKALDLESQDDYIGIAASTAVFGFPNVVGHEVTNYGKRHWWYFDNLQTDKFRITNCWWRFPGLVGVFKRSAGEKISVLDRAGFCLAIFWNHFFPSSRTDVSGRILQWLKNRVMRGDSWVVDKSIDLWEADIKRQYPGQMGEILGIYYGYNHPFSLAMWGLI